jgi:hypothetical protein
MRPVCWHSRGPRPAVAVRSGFVFIHDLLRSTVAGRNLLPAGIDDSRSRIGHIVMHASGQQNGGNETGN